MFCFQYCWLQSYQDVAVTVQNPALTLIMTLDPVRIAMLKTTMSKWGLLLPSKMAWMIQNILAVDTNLAEMPICAKGFL